MQVMIKRGNGIPVIRIEATDLAIIRAEPRTINRIDGTSLHLVEGVVATPDRELHFNEFTFSAEAAEALCTKLNGPVKTAELEAGIIPSKKEGAAPRIGWTLIDYLK